MYDLLKRLRISLNETILVAQIYKFYNLSYAEFRAIFLKQIIENTLKFFKKKSHSIKSGFQRCLLIRILFFLKPLRSNLLSFCLSD